MNHRRRPFENVRALGHAHQSSNAGLSDEHGSSLILAMVFLVAASVVILALASWTMNNLNNTGSFQQVTSKLYAADGATQIAVRAQRYTYPASISSSLTSGGYVCPGTQSPISINGILVQDWCTTVTSGVTISPTVTRTVEFVACQMPSGTTLQSACSATNDVTKPRLLLTAVVNYDDNVAGMNRAQPYCSAISPSLQALCGLGTMSIVSWIAQ